VDSVVYSSGLALRFPRVERIRYDKPCSEVLSKAEVYRIKENFRSGWQTAEGEGRLTLYCARLNETFCTYLATGRAPLPLRRRGATLTQPPPRAAQGRRGRPRSRPLRPRPSAYECRYSTSRLSPSPPPSPSSSSPQGQDEQLHVALQRAGRGPTGHIFRGWVFCVFDCDFTFGRRLKICSFPRLRCSHTAPTDEGLPTQRPGLGEEADDKVRVYQRRELIDMILSEGGSVVATATSPEVRVVASSLARRSLQLDNLIKAKSSVHTPTPADLT